MYKIVDKQVFLAYNTLKIRIKYIAKDFMSKQKELYRLRQAFDQARAKGRLEKAKQALANGEDPIWMGYADVFSVVMELFKQHRLQTSSLLTEEQLRSASKEELRTIAHHRFEVQQILDLVTTKQSPDSNSYQLRVEAIQIVLYEELGIQLDLEEDNRFKEVLENDNWQVFRFVVLYLRQIKYLKKMSLTKESFKAARQDGTVTVLHTIVTNAQEHIIRNISRLSCYEGVTQLDIISIYLHAYAQIKNGSNQIDYSTVDLALITV
jgi:hypothetical protein